MVAPSAGLERGSKWMCRNGDFQKSDVARLQVGIKRAGEEVRVFGRLRGGGGGGRGNVACVGGERVCEGDVMGYKDDRL
jgi:hypothetical protein